MMDTGIIEKMTKDSFKAGKVPTQPRVTEVRALSLLRSVYQISNIQYSLKIMNTSQHFRITPAILLWAIGMILSLTAFAIEHCQRKKSREQGQGVLVL